MKKLSSDLPRIPILLLALIITAVLPLQFGMAKETGDDIKAVSPVVQKTATAATVSNADTPKEGESQDAPAPAQLQSAATGEQIDWQVIGGGGVIGATSTNYSLSGTVGQSAVGSGSSTNYQARHGFWQNFLSSGGASCCIGALTGNVSYDPGDVVDISDLTKLVNFLFVTFEPLDCESEANTSGDASCNIDISDLTKLVNHLFVTFEALAACDPSCG